MDLLSNWPWNVMIILMFSTFSNANQYYFPLSGPNGVFSSPNYPRQYPLNTTCRWTVSAPANKRIQVNFTEFSLERNKKCLYDYLVLIDLPSGRRSARYCGFDLPPIFTSIGNRIEILFKSDSMNGANGKGFKAKWKVVDEQPTVKPASSVPCPTKTITVYQYLPCSARVNRAVTPKCSCSNSEPSGTKSGTNKRTSGSEQFSDNCTVTSSIKSEISAEKVRNLTITFGCLSVFLLIAIVIMVVIWCRRERHGFTSESYLEKCLPSSCTRAESPNMHSHGRPTLKMVNGELAVVYEDEIQCTRPEDNFQTRHSTQRSTRSKGATLKQSQQNLPDIPFNLIPPSLLRTNQSCDETREEDSFAESSDNESEY